VQDIRSVLNDFVADEPRTAPAADGGEEVTEFAEQWTLRKEGTGYTILDANGGIRGHYRDATVMGVHFGFALQERDKLQRELADLRQQLADATRVDERELFWLRDAIREHCRGLVVVIPKPWEVGSRELAEKLNADLGIDLEQEQHGGDSHNVG
jgi:hypothetical protein